MTVLGIVVDARHLFLSICYVEYAKIKESSVQPFPLPPTAERADV